MAVLKLTTYPNPLLARKAQPVGKLSKKDYQFIEDMIDTMYVEDGVGLAAPQVGVSRSIIVVSPNATRGQEKIYLNPEIIEYSEGQELGNEGCLSLPEILCDVRRAKKIKFKAQDINGKEVIEELQNFPARVIQHELDHLKGFLIIDRVDFNKRQALLSSYHRL